MTLRMNDRLGEVEFVTLPEMACPECGVELERITLVRTADKKMVYWHRLKVLCSLSDKYFAIPVSKVGGEEVPKPTAGS